MPLKLKIGGKAAGSPQSSFWMRILRGALLLTLAGMLLFFAIFGYYYYKYQKVVDERIASGPMFASVAQIYAAPREIRLGQKLDVNYVARILRTSYNGNTQIGSYDVHGDSIVIHPGPQSYYASHNSATINTTGGEVQSITAENGAPLRAYKLEPQLITGLSEDKNRTKRRLVTYNEIPKRMVDAVTSIEDREFFNHGGVNYPRLIKCGVEDMMSHQFECGGSTLTMQLARGFFLTPEKHIKRKLIELMITFQLESRFDKPQLFAMYANYVPLGQRGSYAINGFGEAAQSFFGKSLGQLDTAECATIAGMIQSPSRFNPYRHPERVVERRNVVLDAMVDTNALSKTEAERAKAEPLRLAAPNIDASEAPYFIDLVHQQIVQRLGEQDLSHESLRIYTSLDPELQALASAAVDAGMRNVDDLVRKNKHPKGATITYPQVALVAIDPHTGQILAVVGGRNYGVSQLNHATANRPTGSIFKPFVYATAFNSSLSGQSLGPGGVFTALTVLHDTPTTFTFDNGRQKYNPGNFHGELMGDTPAYNALAHSLNIATISLAEQVGFDNVASLARQAGITQAKGTPAVAIGAYSATPIDMAGAYTVFANNGVHLNPWMLDSVRNPAGDILADFAPEAKQVLDPRTAYLTQTLMEGVLNFGTAAAVRAKFTAPAAGKTGTSHDAWFAGYTSNLLCIIWIGNDDYTDVNLQGAYAAAPIWADFMDRATKLPQYSDTKSFTPPDGVKLERIDRESNLVADSSCTGKSVNLAFIDGTQPGSTCSRMGATPQAIAQQVFGNTSPAQATPAPDGSSPESQPAQKKPNIFRRIFGGGNKDNQTEQPQ